MFHYKAQMEDPRNKAATVQFSVDHVLLHSFSLQH